MFKVLIDVLKSLQPRTLMHNNVLVAFNDRLEIENLVSHPIHSLLLQDSSFIAVFDVSQFFINEMVYLAN